MLAEIREEIAGRLAAAGIKAVIYRGETITPPCAVVVPGQPYVDGRSSRDDVPFGHVVVTVDVLLLVAPSPAKTSANRIDDLIERAWPALAPHHYVTRVTRPGDTLPIGGTKYVGAVIRVEEITEEPS